MKQFGLIGHPLGHSFSARFFAEKFCREGIDAEYLNFDIATAEELSALIAAHPALCGLNVTIPHKQAVIPLLDSLSDGAREIGAVNVVRIRRDGTQVRLEGHNTDVVGFSRSIAPLLAPHHRRALVLGTGGASRAVVHGLRTLGVEPVYVSRTHRADLPGAFTYDELTPEVMAAHTVVVNASPVGMFPHVDDAPRIPYDRLTHRHLLYDLVYNPLETTFMRLGAAQGAVVKNGLEMLHLQALAAWEIWQH